MPRGPRTYPKHYLRDRAYGGRLTSLMCWIGVDSRGPASAYIATDSRLSWSRNQTWDFGRKTFASASSPDVFGYCGDVVFPSIVLSQFVSALDGRLQAGQFENRFRALEELVRVSFARSPPPCEGRFRSSTADATATAWAADFMLPCSRGRPGMASIERCSDCPIVPRRYVSPALVVGPSTRGYVPGRARKRRRPPGSCSAASRMRSRGSLIRCQEARPNL